MRQAIGDAEFPLGHKSYPMDELAARYHHRLVCIHPFPNGNGRWSRLVADLLVVQSGLERFTWGSANLRSASVVRRSYIEALQAADNQNFAPLIAFARS